MKRLLTGCLMAASLLAAVTAPAAADPPAQFGPFEDTFEDVNPCDGLVHTVTIAATFAVHTHGDRTVAHGDRTLSTSSGYSGRGTSSFVTNGHIEMFRSSDMLTGDAGNRIRATVAFVLDTRTGSVRIDSFELTCVGS